MFTPYGLYFYQLNLIAQYLSIGTSGELASYYIVAWPTSKPSVAADDRFKNTPAPRDGHPLIKPATI